MEKNALPDFYRLPFKDARRFLRKAYLDLAFIQDLNLDITKLDVKAIYTSTSLTPIILVNDSIAINKYLVLGTTDQSDMEFRQEKRPVIVVRPGLLQIGYKHFDKYKFSDGEQIGDFRSGKANKAVRLQRMIQREVMGFWKYWFHRIYRNI